MIKPTVMVLVGDDDGNDVEWCRDDWCVGVKGGGWWFDGRAAEGRHCVSLDTDSPNRRFVSLVTSSGYVLVCLSQHAVVEP